MELEKFMIDNVAFDVPPEVYDYNEQRGGDYNEVVGKVIKWPNGLMIITGTYDLGKCGTSSSRKWGSFYETNDQNMPHFQESFRDKPFVIYSVVDNNAAFSETIKDMDGERMGTTYFFVPADSSPYIVINFIAIGIWK